MDPRWLPLPFLALGILACLGLLFGSDKRPESSRIGAITLGADVQPIRDLVREKRRSRGRWDRFQSYLVPMAVNLDLPKWSAAEEDDAAKLMGFVGLLFCLMFVGVIVLSHQVTIPRR